MKPGAKGEDALDLLKRVDPELRRVFWQLDQLRDTPEGPDTSVEQRAQYGDLAKQLVRLLATREAALVDVLRVIADVPELGPVGSRLEKEMPVHRPLIDRVEKMSRGVQGINLNAGQDFDGSVQELASVVESEIEWELAQALPAIEVELESAHKGDLLKSASHVTRHAPTKLSIRGPRWVERAPVISRVLTVFDHLRDFPRANRRPP